MNNTNLVGRMQKVALRGLVVAVLALFSTMAFAQASINTLVDATTAVDRLSIHYPAVAANLNTLSERATNYEFEQVRAEFTMHIFEDVQLGIDPADAIQARLDGVSVLSPGATDSSITPTKVASGSLTSPGITTSTVLSDPIVQELITLLQQ